VEAVGRVDDRPADRAAGVVHQIVDVIELAEDDLDGVFHRTAVGDIARESVGLAAELANLRHQLIEGVGAARQREHPPAALGDGVDRGPGPDAAHRDDREDRPPQARAQQADPDGRLGVVAEHAEQHEVRREQEPAAEVAERPAARGDPVAVVRLGDVDQDRVVDDEAGAEAQRREQEQDRPELPVGAGDEEHEHRHRTARPGEAAQQARLVRAPVRDGSHDRQDQRGQDGRDRDDVEDQRPGGDPEPEHVEVPEIPSPSTWRSWVHLTPLSSSVTNPQAAFSATDVR